jgi:exonuclease VII large subunit
MNNKIIIELCAEDRARLDRLTEALERKAREEEHDPNQLTIDDAQRALAETMAKASAPTEKPTEAAEEAKPSPASIDHPVDEPAPWEDPAPAAEEKPIITQEQLQQRVTQMAAANNGALKTKVREIVQAYAKKVSDVPEDKRAEVWDKLTALERGQA